MPYIYKITNKRNNRNYIGVTDKKDSNILYWTEEKNQNSNFNVEELEQCCEKNVKDKMRYWIDYYGSFRT